MKYPPELLQKIRDTVNIVEVIGEHVVLRKSGANYTGLCPFHSERSPSFSVSENKQLYHCYGCKKGGDLFGFVMEMFGISFPEAVEELADRGKIALPKNLRDAQDAANADPETQKKRAEAREKLSTAHKLTRFVAAYFHQQLKQNPAALQYVRGRGVTEDLIKNFYVGAAPASWDALSTYLETKKAPMPLAVELGLVRPSTKVARPGASGYFDLFRDRIMFPILDLRGKVAGYGGRAMGSSNAGAGSGAGAGAGSSKADDGPKYLNSPESFLFHKSKIAFGLYQAQKYIREKDEAIIVEGYFDVLALHAAGFQNVISTCGTSLTPDHLTLLKKFASRIVILFDGDKAGISATERAMETGLENGVILYGASMPEGLDPDEVLFDQHTGAAKPGGREKMEMILGGAHPLLDARIDELAVQAAESPEDKSQALKKIASWLSRYRDEVGREVRMDAVTQKLQVSRGLVDQALRSSGGGASRGPQITSQSSRPQQTQASAPRQSAPPYSPPPEPSYDYSAPPAWGDRPQGRGYRDRGQGQGSGQRHGQHPSEGGRRFKDRGRDRDQPQGLSAPGPAPRKPKARPGELADGDRILLAGAAKGDKYVAQIRAVEANLPPKTTLVEVFEHPAAQAYLAAILNPQAGTDPSEILARAPQVRSIVVEASVKSESGADSEEGVNDLSYDGDFKVALDRAIARLWARFSQSIRTALQDAEAKKDAGLHARLLQEYLDVQRKMKEFISFYDEA